jgi:hypothetical protein
MEGLNKVSVNMIDKLYSDISNTLNNELSHEQHVDIMTLLINNLRDRTVGQTNTNINNAHANMSEATSIALRFVSLIK